jgi:RNA ligase (TIGR02306 family)
MSERKLASIRKISDIQPIEGADLIELAIVDGWKVVVGKEVGHKIGDFVIYCEVDSFLPIREEFEFLRKSSYRKMIDQEGFRLKTIKLRGQVSQGLIIPLSILEGEEEDEKLGYLETTEGRIYQLGPYEWALVIEEGADVTNMLGIVKWDPPMPAELAGVAKGNFPSFIPKTDEERVQNLAKNYDKMKEQKYYMTEKLDGSSSTFYVRDGEFGVCSRNLDLCRPEPFVEGVVMCDDGVERPKKENTFWKVARELGIEENMLDMSGNLAIQCEIIGEGIQGNPYRIKGQTLRVYNAFDIDAQEYLGFEHLKLTTKALGLEMVPIIDEEFTLPETIDELLKFAEGKSTLNGSAEREGYVIRSHDMKTSFKVISNNFLLKEKE